MKKVNGIIGVVLMLFVGFSAMSQQLSAEDKEIVNDAEQARQEFISKDADIQEHFENSAGYVIFPNVGKGAYIVGGAAGNGAVYKNGELIGMAELRQLDVGLQLGGQAFQQVIFFENENALERFKEENIRLSGNASAVALDKGKAASIQFKDGLAIATMPKGGAMVEISVGGQKFKYEPIAGN